MVVTRSASRSQRANPTSQPPQTPSATTTPTATTTTTTKTDVNPSARTIAHMNKDHLGDMIAILQHHARLSASEAAGAEMLDLDLTSMTIRSASGVHTIPLTPPMATWDDRRVRLADMSNDARRALESTKEEEPVSAPTSSPPPPSSSGAAASAGAGANSSSTTPAAIPYHWPRGADWISFAGLTFYWVSCVLVYGGFVTPGSGIWRVLELVRFPYGPVGYIWLVRRIFALVLAIHAFESFWLDRSRLAPGGLRRGSKVWFLWVAAGFFEGLPAYRRWDRLVVGKGVKSE
ncbi:hypothetical protein VMCG_04136 [Cytospora schulzeri]|uniref:DUF2470 domain-containing protein n=1 Tax=Cytospora schulzeri TaxID=448051 RepID=A0A423WTY0_9PEZI|nr:hypothetical protein VMCG_04136 [Valsa malicola]